VKDGRNALLVTWCAIVVGSAALAELVYLLIRWLRGL